jgi:hypothetical protein
MHPRRRTDTDALPFIKSSRAGIALAYSAKRDSESVSESITKQGICFASVYANPRYRQRTRSRFAPVIDSCPIVLFSSQPAYEESDNPIDGYIPASFCVILLKRLLAGQAPGETGWFVDRCAFDTTPAFHARVVRATGGMSGSFRFINTIG